MNPKEIHKWEPTGVTAYPITHPIVGQTDLYQKLKHWLLLVSGDRFAHVFAIVAPWGVGKSRLGYEVVAQVNDASCGWKVRSEHGELTDARLFDSDAERDKHLALYIRYSQVADRRLNLDNWFAPAVYKALAPLARGQLDSSIQHRIAKQSFDRLEAEGFDPARLARAMELPQDHDEQHAEAIYTDTALATRLCNAAFDVLKDYGIEYVVVVLDELETAAERATGSMEAEEARAMDGKSITMLRKAVELLGRADGGPSEMDREAIEMMSKAVKEEDPRARFPWLRFVALCSPAIGDELKEVQSTDRRFEIVDLNRNAFADVSTFVRSLEAEGRLLRTYPKGLVEAAYMMSGANFGWFNVIMAVVDQVLARVPEGESRSLSWVFQRAIEIQERIGRYVLDHRSLDEIPLQGVDRDAAADLLFGQQPRPIGDLDADVASRLLDARNAHGETVAARFHRAIWPLQACAQTLVEGRFQRLSGSSRWTAPGIPEPIDLERLLDDLATMAVHEQTMGDGPQPLLLPGTLPGFLQLLDLVHPHPAAEETGRALWMKLVGSGGIPDDELTHIGPSVDMLRRLDIRLRKASVGAMLRDPAENEALTQILDDARHSEDKRAVRVLTGALRVLDHNWSYDAEPAGLGDDVVAIKTPKDGLVDFKGLWLHPKGQAAFAWVTSDESLKQLAEAVARDHRKMGRYPVVALTTDYELPERFARSQLAVLEKARDSIVVVHINSGEESALLSVGLPTTEWQGFRLRADGFTTRFAERLNRIRNPIAKRVREWRHEIGARGRIAWPLRPSGTLKPESLQRLVSGWRVVMLDHAGKKLGDVGAAAKLDHGVLLQEIDRLGHSPAAAPKGYGSKDAARLWVDQGPEAHPEVPPFLLHSIVLRLFKHAGVAMSADSVKADWFWGFVWDGNRTSDIFREWLTVAVDLGWAQAEGVGKGNKKTQYVFVPREALHGKLAAARKWLEEDYPDIVNDLSSLLGEGLVDTWFKPTTGSKYQNAVQRLDEATRALEELDALETNPPAEDDVAAAQEWFVRATRLRLRAQDLVSKVFNKEGYDQLPADLDGPTLHLTDEERPLWERIRQAKHFADAVQKLAHRIRKRIPSLGQEIRQHAAGIHAFPVSLFVRPLSKIDHIVDAGLTGEDPLCTTKRVQHAKPDTLAYYLKELRVADAMEAIRGFARELGVGERAADDKALPDIDGDIVTGYHDLVERYGAARAVLLDLASRIVALEDALRDVPSNFSSPVALSDVSGRPALIEGELAQSLEDDVEDMLDRHDAEMSYGRFGPLMREARTKLLDSPERALKGLEGKVRTLENAVVAYRQELLEDGTLRAHRSGLNGLRRAKRKAGVAIPEMSDLEPRSLKDGRIYIDGVATGWGKEGTALLDGTGVSFDDWLGVMQAVGDEKDPGLSGDQVDALVREGFLRRIYALAGGDA